MFWLSNNSSCNSVGLLSVSAVNGYANNEKPFSSSLKSLNCIKHQCIHEDDWLVNFQSCFLEFQAALYCLSLVGFEKVPIFN